MEYWLSFDNYQSVYNQVIHTYHSNELPIITIKLYRPLITINFFTLLLTLVFVSTIFGDEVINFLHHPSLFVTHFFPKGLFFIVLFPFIIFGLISTYSTEKLKIFDLMSKDTYYLRLTPQYLEWVLNGEKRQIGWQNINRIKKFVRRHRGDYNTHICLFIENEEDITLYPSNLMMDYKKIWQLLYEYRLRALGHHKN